MTSTVLPDTTARSRSGSDTRGGLAILSTALATRFIGLPYYSDESQHSPHTNARIEGNGVAGADRVGEVATKIAPRLSAPHRNLVTISGSSTRRVPSSLAARSATRMTPNAIAVANRTELLGETGAEVVFVCGEVRSRTDIATGQISVSVRAWILAVSPSLGAAQRAVLGLAQIGVFDVCRPIPDRQGLLRRGMPIGVKRFGLLHG